MQVTVPFLLLIIVFIVLILVVLIAFEGRTNRKVDSILKQVDSLKSALKDKDLQNKRLASMLSQMKVENGEVSFPPEFAIDETDDESQDAPESPAEKEPGFFAKIFAALRNNKFLGEQFIGGNLINKIGIAVLVVGLGFFVRFAFDNDWINNTGRVSIGVFSSGLLVFFAHLLHKNYRTFSSILLGGAMAVLYYSFAIAFYQYELFGVKTAFILMFAITGFSVALSIAYKRLELAMLAALAAFTAPFMVQFSVDNHVMLFSYIILIDIGLLILAYFKKWLPLNLLSYAFTGVFYLLWFVNISESARQVPYFHAFIFISVAYFIFFLMYILNNIRARKRFLPFELSVLISLNILYYTAGMMIIEDINPDYKGLYTALMGLLNLIFLVILYKNKNVDQGLKYLLIGLVVIFAGLIPPVQLVGKSITLVWSLQMVLLLWLAQRIKFPMMKLGSLAMTAGMLISLSMDIWDIYVNTTELAQSMPLFLNIGFITNFVATVALGLSIFLLSKEPEETYALFIKVKPYQAFLAVCMLVALYFTFFLEIKYQLIQHIDFRSSVHIYTGLYNFFFIALLVLPALFIDNKVVYIALAILGFGSVALYGSFYHFEFVTVRNAYLLDRGATFGHFMAHYGIIVLLLGIVLFSLRNWLKAFGKDSAPGKIGLWLSMAVLVLIFSSELDHIAVLTHYREGFLPSAFSAQAHRLAYTILWSVLSLLFMLVGMFGKIKELRSISLTLIFLTFIKLFAYDLGRIERSDQIAAFIVLGSIALIISFLYQLPQKTTQTKLNS